LQRQIADEEVPKEGLQNLLSQKKQELEFRKKQLEEIKEAAKRKTEKDSESPRDESEDTDTNSCSSE